MSKRLKAKQIHALRVHGIQADIADIQARIDALQAQFKRGFWHPRLVAFYQEAQRLSKKVQCAQVALDIVLRGGHDAKR